MHKARQAMIRRRKGNKPSQAGMHAAGVSVGRITAIIHEKITSQYDAEWKVARIQATSSCPTSVRSGRFRSRRSGPLPRKEPVLAVASRRAG